jgi:hypothetical protein
MKSCRHFFSPFHFFLRYSFSSFDIAGNIRAASHRRFGFSPLAMPAKRLPPYFRAAFFSSFFDAGHYDSLRRRDDEPEFADYFFARHAIFHASCFHDTPSLTAAISPPPMPLFAVALGFSGFHMAFRLLFSSCHY